MKSKIHKNRFINKNNPYSTLKGIHKKINNKQQEFENYPYLDESLDTKYPHIHSEKGVY